MMSAKNNRPAFTLLEVLMAIAIAAIIAAAAAPFVADAFDATDRELDDMRTFVRTVREEALNGGEARRIFVKERSLESQSSAYMLPVGWRLEIRRPGDNRFRKPRDVEPWDITADGLCQPLSLRAISGNAERIFEFDPLTALEPPRNP
jgi:prepilin-type N-terminal cleavage/methylation domain-containing protein